MSDEELQELADQAVEYVPRKTAYYARKMNVSYGRITIRNQRTGWGSCSAKGNLNFNCLLKKRKWLKIHENAIMRGMTG